MCNRNEYHIEDDFYEKVEDPNYLKHTLYGDTDSLFIHIPYDEPDILKRIQMVNKTAKDINKLIVDFTTGYILPRCGFSPQYNHTNFKEEMIIDAMIFLDVKKTYAYRQLTKEAVVNENGELIEGKILSKPKVKKTSNLGVKSDTVAITKKIINSMLDLALERSLTSKERCDKAIEKIGEIRQEFINATNEMKFDLVGVPTKWGKKESIINSMILYNLAIENVFQPSSPGYFFYCKFKNKKKIESLKYEFDYNKLNGIVFPYKYDSELIIQKMKEYEIELDLEEQWEKTIYNTTCSRLFEILSNS